MYITTSVLSEIASKCVGSGDGLADDVAFTEVSEWGRGRQAWYMLLLKQTIEYAEQTVPFYRQRLELGFPGSSQLFRLSDLAKFPILSKADISADPALFISESAVSENVHCTSGTTDRRLVIYGNSDEELAKSILRSMRHTGLPNARRPIVLRLYPDGSRRLSATNILEPDVFTLAVGYNCHQSHWFDHTDYLAQTLNETYLLGGHPAKISIFHITPPWLIEFITQKFLERGINPAEFGVRHIVLTGGFSNSRIRRIVNQGWNATYNSSYSCTEIGGECLENSVRPGVYHHSANLYCEIVDVETFEPVQPGEAGLVLLTSLYPFQQVMPLIRYNTGDIAQYIASPHSNRPFVEAFRPIGRIHHCLQTGVRKFLGTRDVIEALSNFREIPQSSYPQSPYPRYELSLERLEGRCVVRLRLESSEIQNSQVQSLQSSVAEALAKEYLSYTYSDSSEDLLFECEILPKGSLQNFYQVYRGR